MHLVIPHCLPYKPTLLFLTGIKLLYIQSSALSVLLEQAGKDLRNALCPTTAKLNATASPVLHTAQNAFLGGPPLGWMHIAKPSPAPVEHSSTEMEDTCKNRSALLQRQPKATTDVLFISTHITDCFKTALQTGKEKLTLIAQDPTADKMITAQGQVPRHESTKIHLPGGAMGLGNTLLSWNMHQSSAPNTSLCKMKTHTDLVKFKKKKNQRHSLAGLTTQVLLRFHRSPRHSAGLTPQHLLVTVKPPAASAQCGTVAPKQSQSFCDHR